MPGEKPMPPEAMEAAQKLEEAKSGETQEVGTEGKKEGAWDRDRLVEWAATFRDDEGDNESWVDETFTMEADGSIVAKTAYLNLDLTNVKQLPNYLTVNRLNINETFVSELPAGLVAREVSARRLQLMDIPADIEADFLDVSDNTISDIPPGIQVKAMDLSGTNVKDLPEDCGALEHIRVLTSQTELIRAAQQRGMTVEVHKY